MNVSLGNAAFHRVIQNSLQLLVRPNICDPRNSRCFSSRKQRKVGRKIAIKNCNFLCLIRPNIRTKLAVNMSSRGRVADGSPVAILCFL